MKKRMSVKVCFMVMVIMMAVGLGGCTKKEASSNVKTVKVGTGNAMPPYCYLGDDGKPTGYDVEVLKEIDSRLGDYSFNIESLDFSTLIVSIDSGALDVVSHQLVKSKVRKEKYLFPEQYYCLSPMSLAVKADSGIHSLDDMAGNSLNQDPASYEYSLLTGYNDAHPGGEIIINAVSDLTAADALKQVSNGQVSAYLTYQSTYESVQKELQLDDLVLTDVALVEDTYIMIGSGNEELCKAMNQALKDMLADGTLSKFSKEYLGQDIFSLYADKITATAE